MKTGLAVFLFAAFAFAQDQTAITAAESACGPQNVHFEVKRDSSRSVPQAEAGQALVVVVQDIGQTSCLGTCLTTRIGLDGAWVGAGQNNSYVSFPVQPGEHHLCANWQSRFVSLSRMVALAHFTAEAGRVYYFRTRVFGGREQNFLDLDALDSDQGRLLVASYPASVSHPSK